MTARRECPLCGLWLGAASKGKAARAKAARKGYRYAEHTHRRHCRSTMHYCHRKGGGRATFRKVGPLAWKRRLGIVNPNGTREACFECHEVVLHNLVLTESQLERLACHFKGKDFVGKVTALNRVVEAGLKALAGEGQ